MRTGMQRYLSLLKTFIMTAVFASGIASMHALETKVGALKYIIESLAFSLSTLSGCLVTAFQSDHRVSILVLLMCVVLGYVYVPVRIAGLSLEELSELRQLMKGGVLMFGLVGVRILSFSLGLSSSRSFCLTCFLIGGGALLELFLGGPRFPVIGYYTLISISSFFTIPALFFVDWGGRYLILLGSAFAASCVYPINRIVLVYLVTAAFLYRGVYSPKEEAYRNLWICVVCSVLLGVSLFGNYGASEDFSLPIIVSSVFLCFTLIMSKWLTHRLKKRARFRVLCSGVCFFPVLAVIACGVGPEGFEVKHAKFFDPYTVLHLASIIVGPFFSWGGRTLALLLSQVFVLGVGNGNSWFVDHKFLFPGALRLAELVAAVGVGWYKVEWEVRYYSLLLCVLVGDMFIAPLSSIFLLVCFAVAHYYMSGDPIVKQKGTAVSPSLRSDTTCTGGQANETSVQTPTISGNQVDMI